MKKIWVIGSAMLVVILTLYLAVVHFPKEDKKEQELSFSDEEMKNTIINAAVQYEIVENKEDFRSEHLDSIVDLNIGYIGYYSSLEDLKLCKKLDTLYIGIPNAKGGNKYYNYWCMKPKQESRERISQLERGLGELLEESPQLGALYISNDDGTCEFNSLDFLQYGGNLRSLWLWEQKELDYSPIYNCKNLKILDLSASDITNLDGIANLEKLEYLCIQETNISEAGDIVKLKNLKHIEVYGTPLADNEEELSIIRDALPDVEIDFKDY